MAERMALTGNDSAAYALKQINPDVVAAYPITPQTELMHKFAAYVADGEVVTEFVRVESEHSAMSAVVGASLAGARACTATSANGLALMWEILYIAASCRCPIVMPVINRALSGPINIHCDHSDSMGARDAGWIQIYSENCQEAYDNAIQAVRIAEHPDVRLPAMVCLDGFILSHTLEALEVNDDEVVRQFIGEFERPGGTLLDVDHPETFGAFALQNYYFEFKKHQVDAMEMALAAIEQVGREYEELTGRSYGLLDPYRCEDADLVLVGLGSTMGTAKQAADDLRQEGLNCGVLKLRCFRPFPAKQIRHALQNAAALGVMDRAISFGLGGPLFHEIRSARYGENGQMLNFIYGLGGRDLSLTDCRDVFRAMAEARDSGRAEPVVRYVGLRE
ncbi:MAG: transketolase C-terminal domain-containing protein [Planctomycetota bacterium]